MRSGVFNVSFEQLSLTALVFPLLSLRLQQSLIFNLSNKRPKKKKNYFHTKFQPQWKDRENSYQVRQVLALFCR